MVLHDQVKRCVAGALMDEKVPLTDQWTAKPYNPQKIAKRLLSCQASWMVLKHKSTDEISLLPVACNAAPCPHCARQRSAILFNRAASKFEKIAHKVSLRWITLTLKNPPFGSLAIVLSHILKAFALLKKSTSNWSPWSAHIAGYIWSLEITINHRAQSWHPHIHLIVDGSFLPLEKLQLAWQRALGPVPGRAIIGECYIYANGRKIPLSEAPQSEIRRHPDTNDPILHDLRAENLLNVIAETTKYILGPFETRLTRVSEIRELMAALHNKRLKGSGGTLLIPGRAAQANYTNLGGLQSVLNPTHPRYVDDPSIFSNIVSFAQARPTLWFNLLRFWPDAFWIEKAAHESAQ